MTDQLYCPKCGPDWHGAYDMNHRCVECGEALKAEKVMERLKAAEEERDALLAHVERLRTAVYRQADTIHGEFSSGDPLEVYLPAAYNESPTASLARLIAEKQAEALELLADRYALDDSAYVVEVIGEARRRADELRRSVEPQS